MQRGNNLFIISIKKGSVESYIFIVFFRVMSKIRNE